MPSIDVRRAVVAVGLPIASLAAATGAVTFLEQSLGIPDASVIYLPAVVITAIVAGTAGAADGEVSPAPSWAMSRRSRSQTR